MNTKCLQIGMIDKYCHVYICKWFLLVMTGCLFLCGCVNTNSKVASSQDIPIIDLTKNYPEKEFVADDADKEYIPLETTDEVLADAGFRIEYVSEQHIVGTNMSRGDIFIFDRNGKVVSYFNNKGGSNNEYTSLSSMVFDEKAQEIFVADIQNKNRCLVYATDGKYVRQFNYPDSSSISKIYDFDEHTLLAYNEHRQDYNAEDINQKMPYVFLSKKDGSVVSRLDLSFPKRNSDRPIIDLGGGVIAPVRISTTYNVKFGQEYIIADKSSDTIFLLTQGKKLTPLFVRTPTVLDENQLTIISVDFKTDTYLFLNTFTYDWNDIRAQISNGRILSLPSKNFAYDLHTGQIFSVSDGPSGINDAPANTAVRSISAYRLLDDLENGKLEGKIKQVAQTIDWDDNPVVEIVKFK